MDEGDSYVRTCQEGNMLAIQVCEITWDGQTPVHQWTTLHRLDDASLDTIETTKKHILADERYFSTCKECDGRYPHGCIEESVCHGCLQDNHGAVF